MALDDPEELAAQLVLSADLSSLPEIMSLSAEQYLAFFGDDKSRFQHAEMAIGHLGMLYLTAEPGKNTEAESHDYLSPGGYPDYRGKYILANYDYEVARRYIAWAAASELENEFFWLSETSCDKLAEMLTSLEAKALEYQADEWDDAAEHASNLLSLYSATTIDGSDIDPDLAIDPGLERAVQDDAAGERMWRVYRSQLSERDILAAGESGVASKRAMAEDLRKRAQKLREQG